MSSETSADESDTDDYSFKVRPLKWIRRRYRKAFHKLDDFYSDHKLTTRSRSMMKPRVTSKHPSKRQMPTSIPEWAVAMSDSESNSPSPGQSPSSTDQ